MSSGVELKYISLFLEIQPVLCHNHRTYSLCIQMARFEATIVHPLEIIQDQSGTRVVLETLSTSPEAETQFTDLMRRNGLNPQEATPQQSRSFALSSQAKANYDRINWKGNPQNN